MIAEMIKLNSFTKKNRFHVNALNINEVIFIIHAYLIQQDYYIFA